MDVDFSNRFSIEELADLCNASIDKFVIDVYIDRSLYARIKLRKNGKKIFAFFLLIVICYSDGEACRC